MIKEFIEKDKQLLAKLTSGRTGQLKSYVAILLVSVGKENFEGEAISAAVKMINEEFKACCIVVADTLQRHNIATEDEISNSNAYAKSLMEGDEWLKRNEPYFVNHFSIPYTIIRWDILINDPSFIKKEQEFTSYIAKNVSFSMAMNDSIEEYGKRLFKHLGEEHFKRIALHHKNSCFSYLKEECVALTLLPKKIPFERKELTPYVIVYPGKPTLILSENREIFIKKEFHSILQNYNDYLNWIPYRFNRIKRCENNTQLRKSKESIIEMDEFYSLKNQVEFINKISEAQLASTEKFLGNEKFYEFKHHLLNFFLNKEVFLNAQELTQVHERAFSIQSTAYIFGLQLTAMFNTLEIKLSNKCKANIVRILKREDKLVNNVNKLLDSSCLVEQVDN